MDPEGRGNHEALQSGDLKFGVTFFSFDAGDVVNLWWLAIARR